MFGSWQQGFDETSEGDALYLLSYIAPDVPAAMAGLEPATSSVM
ncbi:MAG: hypothetical protein ABJH45_01980 [Paracoccaceae bacterium]